MGDSARTVVLIRVPGTDGRWKYGPEYEMAAKAGIARTSSASVRVLHQMDILEPACRFGWWSKLWLFSPAADLPDTVWFADLDTVFLKDLDRLLDALDAIDKPVVGILDWMRPVFASGLMRINRRHPDVLYIWLKAVEWGFRKGHGDQDLIRAAAPFALGTYAGDLAPSYKALIGRFDARASGRARNPTAEDLADASALVFHGKPMPHEVAADPGAGYHELVKEHWRC